MNTSLPSDEYARLLVKDKQRTQKKTLSAAREKNTYALLLHIKTHTSINPPASKCSSGV